MNYLLQIFGRYYTLSNLPNSANCRPPPRLLHSIISPDDCCIVLITIRCVIADCINKCYTEMTLYVTYPISNSYTTTWYPSPNTRIHSITMASIRNCLVNCFIRFCTPLHIYINPTTIPFTWTTDNTTHPCGLALHHYSNPHNVNWCMNNHFAMCCCVSYTITPKRLVCCMMHGWSDWGRCHILL